MSIGPSSDPNITAFFSSSDVEKAARIDTELKNHHLDFVYTIINRPECDKKTLKSVLKGCIDYDCSSLLAIEVIRKKVFDSYEEKKVAILAAAKKGEATIVEELVKMDLDQIELDPKDREQAIKMAIQTYEKIISTDIDPNSLNRFLDIILILLKKGPVSDDTRVSIISLATKAKYLALIEQLLDMPSADDTRSKAVIEFARNNCKIDLVKALLKSGPISEEARSEAVKAAAEGGYLAVIERLLEGGATILEKDRGYAVKAAAKGGYLAIIERLLQGGATISEQDRGRAVEAAARQGHLAVIERLLEGGATILEYYRELAVTAAAEGGYLAIIERLLAGGATISEEARGQAVTGAAFGGHLAVIERLLAGGATISDSRRGNALDWAAQGGHLPIIEVLLANGATISDDARGRAVAYAAAKGHLAVIERLLAGSATISKRDREYAVIHALNGGYLPIIQRLLVDHEDLRGTAVIGAAARGSLAVIETLLANGATISEESRGNAVKIAAFRGHLPVIERLLADGATISEELRGLAVEDAAREGHLAVIETLLANGSTISDEARGQAVVNAAQSGHLPIIEALLVGHEDLRCSAVIGAAAGGHLAVIETLLANGATISEERRGQAVLYAAQGGHLAVIQALLANGATIPEELRASLINTARVGNHVVLLTFLGVPLAATQMVDHRLYVSREKIKEDPASVLSLVSNGFSGVTFLNPDGTEQAGIDAGGLTKQFTHELLDELRLKEVIKLDDKRLPLCDGTANESSYKDLGKFLSVIDQKNIGRTDPIYIGSLFHPDAFDFFKDFVDESLNDHERIKKLANYLKDDLNKELVDFLNIDEPTDDQLNAFRTFMEGVDFAEEGAYSDKTKEELYAICKAPFEPSFKAFSSIVSGFSDPLKAKILAQGKTYAEVMQGPETIDKEALIAKLEVKEYGHLSEEQRLEVLKKRDWIVEKITSELDADPESLWVKKFVVAVTGQEVLPAGKIEIRGIAGVLCKIHTCFNQLDVPFTSLAPHLADKTAEELEALGKEKFFERLELAMETLDYGSS